jgi:two-component system OmpR family sensor kinase
MMGAMTTATTTEEASPDDRAGRPRRSGVSVRTRLTAAIALLVLVALSTAGGLLWFIGNVLIEQRLVRNADQELAEFVKLKNDGVDPATGDRLTSVERLISVYMLRNVPSSSELLAGYWDGRVRVTSASERRVLVKDAAFVTAVEQRLAGGGQVTVDSEWGGVYLDVLPVRDEGTEGAFVVALFVADEQRELRELVRAYTFLASGALVLVLVVAYVVSGRLLAPIRELRTTAQAISETDLSQRIPERGNDDLTELTRTVNEMLERLQLAFAGQREFLDDAGHELRTPLTILQGHLELLDPADRGEVQRTRDLLLDEVERMSRLVDDLILLTKADRPGFIRVAEVDVAALTATVRDKAVAVADRRWQVDSTAEVTAELDEQRITQALLQLVQNAVRHTGVGGVVAIGSAYDEVRDVVRLWVRDDGPGVPPQERERIFRRFARLDDGVTHGEGFGLGLSIVSAIVTGHGGTVGVRDSTGGGAHFEIEVPRERSSARWRES